MKEWKDGKNCWELYLNGQESCILYCDKNYGYYAFAYPDGGSCKSALPGNSLEEAKQAAEKWYIRCLRNSIEIHKRCISASEKELAALAAS